MPTTGSIVRMRECSAAGGRPARRRERSPYLTFFKRTQILDHKILRRYIGDRVDVAEHHPGVRSFCVDDFPLPKLKRSSGIGKGKGYAAGRRPGFLLGGT